MNFLLPARFAAENIITSLIYIPKKVVDHFKFAVRRRRRGFSTAFGKRMLSIMMM